MTEQRPTAAEHPARHTDPRQTKATPVFQPSTGFTYSCPDCSSQAHMTPMGRAVFVIQLIHDADCLNHEGLVLMKSASYHGLGEFDFKRAIVELVESAGDGGMPEDELYAAMERLVESQLSAATLSLWSDGTTRVGWDAAAGELTWRLAEGGTPPEVDA